MQPKMLGNQTVHKMAPFKMAATPSELPDISIPGISKLYGPKYSIVGKFMWLSALIVCCVLCILQIRERIYFFLNTSVAVDVKIMPNQLLNFPYVTICPRGQGVTNRDVIQLLLDHNSSLANTSGPFVHPKNEMSDLLFLPGMTVDSAWNFTKIPADTFTVRTVDDNDDADFFSYTYSPSVTGMCITIRISEKRQVFPPIALVTVLRGTSMVRKGLYGYAIVVHEDPLLLSYDCALGGMVIQTQYVTTLTLKANKFIRIKTRKTPCSEDHEEVFKCRKRCLDNTVATKINCSLPVHNLPALAPCSSPSSAQESIRATLNHYIYFEWSRCPCPPKCLEMLYDIKWRAEPLREEATGVHLRFHSSALEITEEAVAYNGVSLFCDIGSILSLLLGVCLLTFLQMVEILLFSVRSCQGRPRRKRVINKGRLATQRHANAPNRLNANIPLGNPMRAGQYAPYQPRPGGAMYCHI